MLQTAQNGPHTQTHTRAHGEDQNEMAANCPTASVVLAVSFHRSSLTQLLMLSGPLGFLNSFFSKISRECISHSDIPNFPPNSDWWMIDFKTALPKNPVGFIYTITQALTKTLFWAPSVTASAQSYQFHIWPTFLGLISHNSSVMFLDSVLLSIAFHAPPPPPWLFLQVPQNRTKKNHTGKRDCISLMGWKTAPINSPHLLRILDK